MTAQASLTDELLRSAAALRSLARDLVGRDAAEDLVQEAMLRAWRSPPAERHGLLPWLQTTLRNLASNKRRDEARRRARELRFAEQQPTLWSAPCPVSLERLREVTTELEGLAEPYRRTLTQRYFGGLTPGEIAAQDGIAVATVKSRLQRGLALLRAALERRAGADWRRTLVAATGLARSTDLPMMGIFCMTTASKTIAALAACVAIWWLWPSTGERPTTQSADTTRTELRSADGAVAGAATRVPDFERAGVAAVTSSLLARLAQPFEYRLECRVRDRDGWIVPTARLALAPRGITPNRYGDPVGDDGAVTLVWRAKVPTMTVWLGLLHEDRAQVLRELVVHADRPASTTLLADAGGSTCGSAAISARSDCRQCHVGTAPTRLFDLQATAELGLHPDAIFRAQMLRRLAVDRSTDEVAESYSDSTDVFDDSADANRASPVTTIRGFVRDPDGQAIAGVTVATTRLPDLAESRTRTHDDGSYELRDVAAGAVDVVAGGDVDGRARATATVIEGQVTAVDFVLRSERSLLVQVRVPAGIDPRLWLVEHTSGDGAWADASHVRSEGEFTLADLPPEPGTLLLFGHDGRWPLATLRDTPSGGAVLVDLDGMNATRGRLRLQSEALDGSTRDALQAFVFQQASERGAVMTRSGSNDFEARDLASGAYRVTLVGPPFGSIDLGEFHVTESQPIEIPVGTPPPIGRLCVRAPDGTTLPHFELYLRLPQIDLRAGPIDEGDAAFELPVGDWLVMWGDAAAPLHREFVIEQYGEVEVVLDR